MKHIETIRYYDEDVNTLSCINSGISVHLNFDWNIHKIYVGKIQPIMWTILNNYGKRKN